MSVTTTSDEYVDLARYELRLAEKHVERALAALQEAFAEGTWGEDEWSEEFRQDVEAVRERVMLDLKRARKTLGKRRYIGVPARFRPSCDDDARST